jgi:anti-anti-sigma regulatory factor
MTAPPFATVIAPPHGQLRQVASCLANRAAIAGPGVALDLAGVPAVGGRDLGAVVALHRAVRAAGGRVSVLNASRLVAEAFAVTRLDTLVDVRTGARAA